MKTKVCNYGLFFLLGILTFGCLENHEIEDEVKNPQFKIIEASLTEKNSVSKWILSSVSGRISSSFNVANLQK